MVANDHNGNRGESFRELHSSVPSVFPSQPNDFELNRDDRPETFIRMSEKLKGNVKEDTRQSGYFHSLDPLLRNKV